MKYLVTKDKKNRKMYKKFEKKRRLLKSLILNKFLDYRVRFVCKTTLVVIQGYKSLIRNYCIVTARSRGIITAYGLSRMLFKQYGSMGYLKGIKKASW